MFFLIFIVWIVRWANCGFQLCDIVVEMSYDIVQPQCDTSVSHYNVTQVGSANCMWHASLLSGSISLDKHPAMLGGLYWSINNQILLPFWPKNTFTNKTIFIHCNKKNNIYSFKLIEFIEYNHISNIVKYIKDKSMNKFIRFKLITYDKISSKEKWIKRLGLGGGNKWGKISSVYWESKLILKVSNWFWHVWLFSKIESNLKLTFKFISIVQPTFIWEYLNINHFIVNSF